MATYLDGSAVVKGPFGGDDLKPWEIRLIVAAEARARRGRRRRVASVVIAAAALVLAVGVLALWP